ncbi:STM3941 family protein [Flavivirga eckloniae]|uniref:Uncharacterized protein n=1 Tax=Flavivirga eckloniae TaxID=1803846 RepID=A0A2K9PPW4_9FLAO|nr:STM3941 family protein [Flavivirga eckloniae]AUP78607.1 hypothetical protein C1H87_07730 [Flavivirga eckloniae]
MDDKIEIELSKTKIVLLLIGAMIFVAIGLLFIVSPEKFALSQFRNPHVLRIIGIASAGFFGLCLVFGARKLFDSKIGLTIDQNGINDNTNATSIGLIEWRDITGVKTVQVASTKTLMVLTNNPEKYIDRAKNAISKRAMKANSKMYGSPLSIISSSLKIKHNDLEKLIITELQKRGK